MIKLDLEYYCQCEETCKYFEPVGGTYFDDATLEYHTGITCKKREMCKDLYKRFTAIAAAASIDPDSCE